MKILCIYHSRDIDGWASGAVVKKWCKENGHDIELVGWDYGNEIPFDKIFDIEDKPSVDILFICDVSLTKEAMEEMYNRGVNMVWCDHHSSALKDAVGMNYENCDGIRTTELAGCELTWNYCYPDEDMPQGLEYLGLYDSFRYPKGGEEEQTILKFQYASRAYMIDVDTIPEFIFGFEIDDINAIEEWIEMGEPIYEYVKSDSTETYKKHKFDVDIEGHKFVCVPKERFNPVNYGIDYHSEGYDGAACFWYRGSDNIWEFSLYNENGKLNVADIAKKMGGGGHQGAAGFTVEDINTIIKQGVGE